MAMCTIANNKENEKVIAFFNFHDIRRKNTVGKNARPTSDSPLNMPLK